ncbi:RagB/SusD family nutrient uptake outer membrane protein [Dyadobacter sp. CY312]|uniref:RagB/SusD family nutrient uptake outer membrane protein n=1 Tax=Dyadobacter sp. CY312 TaxID=2907303 RepID=UPI001F19F443|nr:RagB/SusD family nutrient uptake outer membrane protein [Dyadobacter sp. CY312]MCE7043264.1 RagB/SusD family nutrient uptake outer membrane protein [Dyadobacter sp. CY312]
MKIYKNLVLSICLFFGSCTNFLDVSDELAGGLTSINDVFNNVAYTKRWYSQIFDGVPDYSSIHNLNYASGTQNPWTSMADEVFTETAGGAQNAGIYSEWNSASNNFHRWAALFNLIRQANIFIENAKPISSAGVNAQILTKADIDRYIADARFMRAFYYYLLLEMYGPVPIVEKSLNLTDELDYERRPIDEVVNFIDRELLLAMEGMHQGNYHSNENFRAVPTKGTALALRAKLWVYAASPLFNGGFEEGFQLKTSEGTPLFPARDANKWKKAAEACKDFITFAEAGNYDLYKAYTNGVLDPERSVYELFQEYNSEVIWATAKNSWGGMDGSSFDRRATPTSEQNGQGDIAVVQELVDDFYMKDGLPIKDKAHLKKSPLYKEEGYSPFNGSDVNNMYINREPRFYNTVFFSGRKWHITNNTVTFHLGGNADRTKAYYPMSGFMLYKRFNRTVHKRVPGVTSRFRPSYIFRLAEFYLIYAEALNEAEPGSADILKYVNLVRTRAGLPDLEVLNPAIKGNQELQRKAIQLESRIELATEGQRYFDVKRWMLAENEPGEGGLGGDFHGKFSAGNAAAFDQRVKFQTRIWKRKNYLFPVPLVALQKSTKLVQNPGW